MPSKQKKEKASKERLKIVKKTKESNTKGDLNVNLRRQLKISQDAENYNRPRR